MVPDYSHQQHYKDKHTIIKRLIIKKHLSCDVIFFKKYIFKSFKNQ